MPFGTLPLPVMLFKPETVGALTGSASMAAAARATAFTTGTLASASALAGAVNARAFTEGALAGDAAIYGLLSAATATTGVPWLDGLPAPMIAGYRLAPATNVVRAAMEFGAPRVRRRGTRPLSRVAVQFVMTTWQQMLFEGFYRWRAEEGGGWFDIELAFPIGLRWVTARFVGDITQVPLGANVWRTTAELEVLERLVISEAEFAAALDEEDDPSAPAWPRILPLPTYDGYGLTDHPVLARSGDDLRGLPAQRRRSIDRVTEVSCRWVLTAAQAATWDGFFVRRALEGARWFSMPVFSGVGLTSSLARFTGECTWTPLGGGNWSVEAPMELRERTMLTAADLAMLEVEDV